MRVGRAVGRDVGALRDKSEMREIRTPDWKCNRSRLKVKWRRVRLGEAGRKGVRYGMVVKIVPIPPQRKFIFPLARKGGVLLQYFRSEAEHFRSEAERSAGCVRPRGLTRGRRGRGVLKLPLEVWLGMKSRALLQIVENRFAPRRPTLIQRGILGSPAAGWAPRRCRIA